MTRLRRQLRRAHLLRRWWVWLLAVGCLYLGTLATLRWLLHDHLVVATVHEPAGRRVVIYLSVFTEFASGSDRIIVMLGRNLLPPVLVVEAWVRTQRLPD